MKSQIHAWARLLRLGNLPTVLSNVLVGWAIGGWPADGERLLAIGGVVGVIYLAGMVLNDVVDVEVDRRSRADRPLVTGTVRRGTAGTVAVLLLLLAVGATAPMGPAVFTATAILASLVVIYDLSHRFWPVAILGMALCRSMVYLVAALAATDAPPGRWLLIAMLALGLWTAGLTLLARREARDDPMRWSVALLPVAALITVLVGCQNLPLAALTGSLLVLQLLWILVRVRADSVIPAVLAAIAGISLLDALLLSLLDAPIAALVAVCCFAVVTLLHRPLPGT